MKKTIVLIIIAVLVVLVLLVGGIIWAGAPVRAARQQVKTAERFMEDLEYEKAIAAYEAALSIDPKNETILAQMADAYLAWAEQKMADGDLDGAMEILRQGYDRTGNISLQEKMDEVNEHLAAAERNQEEASAMVKADEDLEGESGSGEEVSEGESVDFGMSGTVYVEDTDRMVKRKVTFSVEGQHVAISLTTDGIALSYELDKASTADNALEYCWSVRFTDGVNTYEVGTMHFKNTGMQPRTGSFLMDMQQDLWLVTESSGTAIGVVELTELGGADTERITWHFNMPEGYALQGDGIKILECFTKD